MKFPVHTNKLNHYIKKGLHGQGWYDETFNNIKDIFGMDAELFCDLLSATSANTSVKGNVTLALKAYRQYKNNEKFTGYLPVVVNMLNIIKINYITGHHAPYGSEKIQNFAKALKGDLSVVVVDRWMLRAFGYRDKSITPKRYREITQWITDRAASLGMLPSQLQAAIWCGIKELEDETGNDAGNIESFLLI